MFPIWHGKKNRRKKTQVSSRMAREQEGLHKLIGELVYYNGDGMCVGRLMSYDGFFLGLEDVVTALNYNDSDRSYFPLLFKAAGNVSNVVPVQNGSKLGERYKSSLVRLKEEEQEKAGE